MRSRLNLWTSLERNAPNRGLPPRPDPFTATSRAGAIEVALDQVYMGSTSGGVRLKSLKSRERGVDQKWSRVKAIYAGCTDIAANEASPSPLREGWRRTKFGDG